MVENYTVHIVRCPDGYCCQDNATCHGIDSCNINRTGTLCATCAEKYTESLFSTECFPAEECNTILTLILYIVAVVVCSVALITVSLIKDQILLWFRNGYRNIKKLLGNSNKNVNFVTGVIL